MAERFDMTGAQIGASQIGGSGNLMVNGAVNGAGRAGDEVLRLAREWLRACPGKGAAEARVHEISERLGRGDERGARGFIRRNWESIAADLAGTALWAALCAFMGGTA